MGWRLVRYGKFGVTREFSRRKRLRLMMANSAATGLANQGLPPDPVVKSRVSSTSLPNRRVKDSAVTNPQAPKNPYAELAAVVCAETNRGTPEGMAWLQ